MTNQLVPINWHASLPAHLRQDTAFAEMSSLGAAFESRAFARVSTNNNSFALVNLDGETMQVNQIDAGAVYLDLVFVKWAPHVTKTWYAGAYQAGSDAAPDCFSMDGKVPDAASKSPQAATCASCPMNAFGSSANGKGKACSDGQRTAIVLGADTPVSINGVSQVIPAAAGIYGYRLPPMTGKNLRVKVKEFEKAGVNLMGVVLRAKFVSQGEVDFKAVKYVSEEDWKRSRELAGTDDALRACGLDQMPRATAVLAGAPAHAQMAADVAKAEESFLDKPTVVPVAATTTAAVADAAPARRRGRPPTNTPQQNAAFNDVKAEPVGIFDVVTPPAQTNGVIQTPKASSSALDDLLAQAMA